MSREVPHYIALGTAFKPFAGVRRFCRAGEGDRPFLVPESYDYILALRKEVRLYGVQGSIDVITEDPNAMWQKLFCSGKILNENPLGETQFESIYRGQGKEEFTEQPTILRVSFLVRNPRDYARLLDTYAFVKIGQEKYMLFWDQNRPLVKRNLQLLEEGQQVLTAEKNLFNVKDFEQEENRILTDEEKDAYEKIEFDRLVFVWLPAQLEPLRTIKFTFNQFGGGDGDEQPPEPIEPKLDRIPVLV